MSIGIRGIISGAQQGMWANIHGISAYVAFIITAIHIGMYWKIVMAFFRKLFGIKEKNEIRTICLRICALILAILGVKGSFDQGIYGKITGGSRDTKEKVSEMAGIAGVNTEVSEATNVAGDKKNVSEAVNVAGDKKKISETVNVARTEKEVSMLSYGFEEPVDDESEEDYLGRLICTGCGRRCSLLKPKCGKGKNQASQAVLYYNEYNENSDANNDANNDVNNDANDDANMGMQDTDASQEKQESSSTIIIDAQEDETLASLLLDYIPIMGLYISGTYYGLEVITKRKSKK